MKNFILIILLLAVCVTAKAHVGSAGVQMQGQAGPYKVLVSIEPPDVIPGTAKITVFVENGNAKKVLARPIYFYSGDKGAPSPDELTQVAGQTGQFQGVVWLMESGSSGAQIQIEGDQGKGELVVPIAAVSTAERDMPKNLGIGLSILGVLLFLLMITTIGASVSDGILRPGETLTPVQRRKRWVNMGIATVICSLILYGGSSWWDSWAAEYKQWLYKPIKGSAAILQANDQRVFQLKIDTTGWNVQRRGSMLSTLIPDHGKLMHTFLVRTPGLDAFAHIHPERKDSTTFEAFLPKLPAGKYLVYSDIVQRSGFAETIVDTIDIPEQRDAKALLVTAEEDTYVVTDPINAPGNVPLDENVVICGKPGTKTVFKDGSYAVWEGMSNKPLDAGKPYQLTFEFFNPDGSACYPEPYLGMTGHVAVVRTDGSVYIHLHPTGTFAMAAEQTFKDRMADTATTAKAPAPAMFRDSIDRYLAKLKAMPMEEREVFLMTEMGMYDIKDGAMTGMDHGNRISFPYSFPKAGRYRIFLQLKRNAKVLTGAYDVTVKDAVTL
ncbi:hypothetical protein [Dyadobacter fanqingshengii]|uniref:Uncharacterized protein n=1 Tax=Dyadobacter fanqingshengii TaxID=2906443 RepID=A0A9X1PDI9_9BACT|nr:hypothetical protein [Dyadobacter fanqingshengii]MCF0043153.1 hypothetical protein [Dyadobacter fanqingshengii]MCF0043231.1 hypothetical protein [Dyadobacter fanqingshengii]USJ35706.1 hypothetical protein NFI81_23825 [Dyadobacter fanqingshengii]